MAYLPTLFHIEISVQDAGSSDTYIGALHRTTKIRNWIHNVNGRCTAESLLGSRKKGKQIEESITGISGGLTEYTNCHGY